MYYPQFCSSEGTMTVRFAPQQSMSRSTSMSSNAAQDMLGSLLPFQPNRLGFAGSGRRQAFQRAMTMCAPQARAAREDSDHSEEGAGDIDDLLSPNEFHSSSNKHTSSNSTSNSASRHARMAQARSMAVEPVILEQDDPADPDANDPGHVPLLEPSMRTTPSPEAPPRRQQRPSQDPQPQALPKANPQMQPQSQPQTHTSTSVHRKQPIVSYYPTTSTHLHHAEQYKSASALYQIPSTPGGGGTQQAEPASSAGSTVVTVQSRHKFGKRNSMVMIDTKGSSAASATASTSGSRAASGAQGSGAQSLARTDTRGTIDSIASVSPSSPAATNGAPAAQPQQQQKAEVSTDQTKKKLNSSQLDLQMDSDSKRASTSSKGANASSPLAPTETRASAASSPKSAISPTAPTTTATASRSPTAAEAPPASAEKKAFGVSKAGSIRQPSVQTVVTTSELESASVVGARRQSLLDQIDQMEHEREKEKDSTPPSPYRVGGGGGGGSGYVSPLPAHESMLPMGLLNHMGEIPTRFLHNWATNTSVNPMQMPVNAGGLYMGGMGMAMGMPMGMGNGASYGGPVVPSYFQQFPTSGAASDASGPSTAPEKASKDKEKKEKDKSDKEKDMVATETDKKILPVKPTDLNVVSISGTSAQTSPEGRPAPKKKLEEKGAAPELDLQSIGQVVYAIDKQSRARVDLKRQAGMARASTIAASYDDDAAQQAIAGQAEEAEQLVQQVRHSSSSARNSSGNDTGSGVSRPSSACGSTRSRHLSGGEGGAGSGAGDEAVGCGSTAPPPTATSASQRQAHSRGSSKDQKGRRRGSSAKPKGSRRRQLSKQASLPSSLETVLEEGAGAHPNPSAGQDPSVAGPESATSGVGVGAGGSSASVGPSLPRVDEMSEREQDSNGSSGRRSVHALQSEQSSIVFDGQTEAGSQGGTEPTQNQSQSRQHSETTSFHSEQSTQPITSCGQNLASVNLSNLTPNKSLLIQGWLDGGGGGGSGAGRAGSAEPHDRALFTPSLVQSSMPAPKEPSPPPPPERPNRNRHQSSGGAAPTPAPSSRASSVRSERNKRRSLERCNRLVQQDSKDEDDDAAREAEEMRDNMGRSRTEQMQQAVREASVEADDGALSPICSVCFEDSQSQAQSQSKPEKHKQTPRSQQRSFGRGQTTTSTESIPPLVVDASTQTESRLCSHSLVSLGEHAHSDSGIPRDATGEADGEGDGDEVVTASGEAGRVSKSLSLELQTSAPPNSKALVPELTAPANPPSRAPPVLQERTSSPSMSVAGTRTTGTGGTGTDTASIESGSQSRVYSCSEHQHLGVETARPASSMACGPPSSMPRSELMVGLPTAESLVHTISDLLPQLCETCAQSVSRALLGIVFNLLPLEHLDADDEHDADDTQLQQHVANKESQLNDAPPVAQSAALSSEHQLESRNEENEENEGQERSREQSQSQADPGVRDSRDPESSCSADLFFESSISLSQAGLNFSESTSELPTPYEALRPPSYTQTLPQPAAVPMTTSTISTKIDELLHKQSSLDTTRWASGVTGENKGGPGPDQYQPQFQVHVQMQRHTQRSQEPLFSRPGSTTPTHGRVIAASGLNAFRGGGGGGENGDAWARRRSCALAPDSCTGSLPVAAISSREADLSAAGAGEEGGDADAPAPIVPVARPRLFSQTYEREHHRRLFAPDLPPILPSPRTEHENNDNESASGHTGLNEHEHTAATGTNERRDTVQPLQQQHRPESGGEELKEGLGDISNVDATKGNGSGRDAECAGVPVSARAHELRADNTEDALDALDDEDDDVPLAYEYVPIAEELTVVAPNDVLEIYAFGKEHYDADDDDDSDDVFAAAGWPAPPVEAEATAPAVALSAAGTARTQNAAALSNSSGPLLVIRGHTQWQRELEQEPGTGAAASGAHQLRAEAASDGARDAADCVTEGVGEEGNELRNAARNRNGALNEAKEREGSTPELLELQLQEEDAEQVEVTLPAFLACTSVEMGDTFYVLPGIGPVVSTTDTLSLSPFATAALSSSELELLKVSVELVREHDGERDGGEDGGGESVAQKLRREASEEAVEEFADLSSLVRAAADVVATVNAGLKPLLLPLPEIRTSLGSETPELHLPTVPIPNPLGSADSNHSHFHSHSPIGSKSQLNSNSHCDSNSNSHPHLHLHAHEEHVVHPQRAPIQVYAWPPTAMLNGHANGSGDGERAFRCPYCREHDEDSSTRAPRMLLDDEELLRRNEMLLNKLQEEEESRRVAKRSYEYHSHHSHYNHLQESSGRQPLSRQRSPKRSPLPNSPYASLSPTPLNFASNTEYSSYPHLLQPAPSGDGSGRASLGFLSVPPFPEPPQYLNSVTASPRVDRLDARQYPNSYPNVCPLSDAECDGELTITPSTTGTTATDDSLVFDDFAAPPAPRLRSPLARDGHYTQAHARHVTSPQPPTHIPQFPPALLPLQQQQQQLQTHVSAPSSSGSGLEEHERGELERSLYYSNYVLNLERELHCQGAQPPQPYEYKPAPNPFTSLPLPLPLPFPAGQYVYQQNPNRYSSSVELPMFNSSASGSSQPPSSPRNFSQLYGSHMNMNVNVNGQSSHSQPYGYGHSSLPPLRTPAFAQPASVQQDYYLMHASLNAPSNSNSYMGPHPPAPASTQNSDQLLPPHVSFLPAMQLQPHAGPLARQASPHPDSSDSLTRLVSCPCPYCTSRWNGGPPPPTPLGGEEGRAAWFGVGLCAETRAGAVAELGEQTASDRQLADDDGNDAASAQASSLDANSAAAPTPADTHYH